jgi:hypothetical protein
MEAAKGELAETKQEGNPLTRWNCTAICKSKCNPRKNASHNAAQVGNMAILMKRPEQVWERAVSPSCRNCPALGKSD